MKSITIESAFDPAKYPIYILPIVTMSAKRTDEDMAMMNEAIEHLVNRAKGRILIHSVSYDLTEAIFSHLSTRVPNRNIYSYKSPQDKDIALSHFKDDPDGVIVAPSLDRGVDLAGDLCRTIIIAKVPFPYLGDKQIAARLRAKNGQLWYLVKTVRTIVQMTGRGMRSADDYCESFILDTQFQRIFKMNTALFPIWWRNAVVDSRSIHIDMLKAFRSKSQMSQKSQKSQKSLR